MNKESIILKKLVTILLKEDLHEGDFDKDDYETAVELIKESGNKLYSEYYFCTVLFDGSEENPIGVLEEAKEVLWEDADKDSKLANLISEILGIDFPLEEVE